VTLGGTPRVTIGIPFYNEERHLGAAIRSMLEQSEQDTEILLVDDGSTDASLAIARSFEDPRITVIADGQRRHLPARLNEITRRARADLVARMDADDVSHPRRLELELELLTREPWRDVVGTWITFISDEGTILAVTETSPQPWTPRDALERGLIAHATMLARRAWLRKNPYDEQLTRTEDRDLWIRTVRTSSFGVVPLPLHAVHVSFGEARFVAAYLEAQRQNRRLLVRHGPSAVGLMRTLRLCVSSKMKGIVVRTAGAAGLLETLVRRRGRPPTDAELTWIREAIEPGAYAGGSRSAQVTRDDVAHFFEQLPPKR
jgi:glycosyltransferase involved in cell wall biosynthesis